MCVFGGGGVGEEKGTMLHSKRPSQHSNVYLRTGRPVFFQFTEDNVMYYPLFELIMIQTNFKKILTRNVLFLHEI